MKDLINSARVIACLVVICCFAGAGSQVAMAQKPTSGALLTIDGSVGTTPVHLTIYDSQIHSGVVQSPPCDPNFPTDAYVLQGGSWTGCDPGDAYEITDGNSNLVVHQHPGIANLTGQGYAFHIETHYVCGGACTIFSAEVPYCNTSGTICASPDSGFLTVTNNSTAAFTGTITLQGNSPVHGEPFCPVNGVALDSSAAGLAASGGAVTLGLGSQGSPADTSNCGGFNAAQTMALTQGVTTKFQIGGNDLEITPFLGGTGDSLTVLPIPVPAGPLMGGGFGGELVLPALSSRFSANNFPSQASIPYADLSAPGNPVGLEFQVSCSFNNIVNGNDCSNFIYTMQTDFTIDPFSYPNGIGGAHFLGHHEGNPVGYDGACPTSDFNVDIFLAYTGGIGDPPLLGTSDGMSCFVGTFNPAAAPVPAGAIVKQQTLVGFQAPVSDTKLNVIKPGSSVPLIWQTFDSAGNQVTNLTLCPHFGGSGCTAPWVFIGTTPVACTTEQISNTTETTTVAPGSSGLQNQGNGTYQFNWQTVKGSTGCVTPVLQFSTGFVSFSVANFQYK